MKFMIYAILSMILLYIVFGITVWQFWTLMIISDYNLKDQKIEKLFNIPLTIFILFWPISFIFMLIIILLRK